jgi:hypothetical protein
MKKRTENGEDMGGRDGAETVWVNIRGSIRGRWWMRLHELSAVCLVITFGNIIERMLVICRARGGSFLRWVSKF